MADVRQQILTELTNIEKEEHVRILYACESGSPAWGFPSKDSDFDVRFIYIRPEDWYVSIFEKRDVIERPINDLLDINGWDLRKALGLFRKSNPPLLEWLQSPIVYAEDGTVTEQIRGTAMATFSPKSCMYHYLHMAKGNYREYLQGERVRIKKYFYVLRPVLACGWIAQRGAMPPIEFDKLVDALVPTDSELYQAIAKLLIRKRAGDELDMEPKVSCINDFIEEKLSQYERIAATLPGSEGGQDEQLDAMFRGVLRTSWR